MRYMLLLYPIPPRLCHVIYCHGDKSYPCLVEIGLNFPRLSIGRGGGAGGNDPLDQKSTNPLSHWVSKTAVIKKSKKKDLIH